MKKKLRVTILLLAAFWAFAPPLLAHSAEPSVAAPYQNIFLADELQTEEAPSKADNLKAGAILLGYLSLVVLAAGGRSYKRAYDELTGEISALEQDVQRSCQTAINVNTDEATAQAERMGMDAERLAQLNQTLRQL